jgi:hypothetical protein
MIRTTLALALALVTLAAVPASADFNYRHGSLCGAKQGSADAVGVDERGIYNGSTTAPATVTCAAADRVSTLSYRSSESNGELSIYETYTPVRIVKAQLWGRDLSTTTPLSCYSFWTAQDGFSSWGPTKYACATAGGCTTSTSASTGIFSIDWNLGSEVDDTDHVGVVCNLPPSTSAGNSYVKSVVTVNSHRE